MADYKTTPSIDLIKMGVDGDIDAQKEFDIGGYGSALKKPGLLPSLASLYNKYNTGGVCLKYKQLSFLRDVDGEKTKKAVEEALEKYRMYMLTIPDEYLPRVTQTYSLVPSSQTNAFSSSTEDAAIKKVDFERERDEYMERIRRAVNRLNKMERELIIKRYMTMEEPYDYEVYNEMGISESKFYRIREKAFYKLAFALRIEVYRKMKEK